MLRRQVLLGLGAAAATALTAMPMRARASSNRDTLVFVFLRGGADGLNMVIPHADTGYFNGSQRDAYGVSIAKNDILDLDGHFGLNPALSALKQVYTSQHLAFVHAAGVTGGNHSHFAMQDFIEHGKHASGDGWVKRYFEQVDPKSATVPFRAVALAGRTQKSLAGDYSSLTADRLEDFSLDVGSDSTYKTTLGNLLNSQHPFDLQGKQVLSVLDDVQTKAPWSLPTDNGASYTSGLNGAEGAFVRRMAAAAQVIKTYPDLEVVCLDFDGWDTHADQLTRMQGKLQALGDTLSAFYTDMGDHMGRVTVVVLSEFGRRITANNTKGTDHGLGGCMLVMGHGVVGGQVYARHWKREDNQLLLPADDGGMNHGGNLRVTTDYRAVLAELLTQRMQLPLSKRDLVFPGFAAQGEDTFNPHDMFYPA